MSKTQFREHRRSCGVDETKRWVGSCDRMNQVCSVFQALDAEWNSFHPQFKLAFSTCQLDFAASSWTVRPTVLESSQVDVYIDGFES